MSIGLAAILVALHSPGTSDFSVNTNSLSRPNYYTSTVRYLVFNRRHALSGAINPMLKQFALDEQRNWLKETKQMRAKPIAPWEQDCTMEVVRNSPRLVSIRYSYYDYSGGAHPNHGEEAFNFALIDGKARRANLKDFFKAGFDAKAYVSKLLIAKLMRTEGADWVQNGDLKTLDDKMSQRFYVGQSALTWHFNPYEVGPYAAGDFDVKLTAQELGPNFKRAMLAGR